MTANVVQVDIYLEIEKLYYIYIYIYLWTTCVSGTYGN